MRFTATSVQLEKNVRCVEVIIEEEVHSTNLFLVLLCYQVASDDARDMYDM